MRTGTIVALCIVVVAMFFIGYIFGRIEERVNGSVAKKLDISRWINNSNASVEVERGTHHKRSSPMVPDMDRGDLRNHGN